MMKTVPAVVATLLVAASPAKADCPRGTKRVKEDTGENVYVVACVRTRDGKLQRHGPYRRYYFHEDCGAGVGCTVEKYTIERGAYRGGLRHGIWRQSAQFEEGLGGPLSRGRYVAGKRSGRWVLWGEGAEEDTEGNLIRWVGSFKDGMRVGRWSGRFTKLRRRFAVGSYRRGKRHGSWRYWYSNGKRRMVGSFVDGVKEGLWTDYHSDGGKVYTVGSYKAGQQEGRWEWRYESGKRWSEAQMRAGKEHGKVRGWHDNGQLEVEKQMVEGRRDGLVQRWHYNGKLYHRGHYRRGRPHGRLVYRFASGKPNRDGEMRDGAPHGRWTWWWSGGKKAATGGHRGGKRDGEWTFWSSDGAIKFTVQYRGGLPSGKIIEWGSRAEKIAEASLISGKYDGRVRLYAGSNNKRWLGWEGSFAAGQPHGVFRSLYEGKQQLLVEYRRGQPHGRLLITEGAGKVEGRLVEGKPHGRWVISKWWGFTRLAGRFVKGRAVGKWELTREKKPPQIIQCSGSEGKRCDWKVLRQIERRVKRVAVPGTKADELLRLLYEHRNYPPA